MSVSESVCLFVEKMSKCATFLRKVEKGPIPQVILEHTYPELSVARATLVTVYNGLGFEVPQMRLTLLDMEATEPYFSPQPSDLELKSKVVSCYE